MLNNLKEKLSIIIIIIISSSSSRSVVGRVFANGPGDRDSIPGRVITKTLDTSLLNSQYYNVCIKGKVELLKREPSGRPRQLNFISSSYSSSSTSTICGLIS